MKKRSLSKKELVKALNKEASVEAPEVERVLNALDEVVANALAEGKRVYLDNIGTLALRTRKETTRYVPKTGERKTVPEHYYVKYSGSETLIERVEQRIKALEDLEGDGE